MQYAVMNDPDVELNEHLRMELGWTGVSSGLTKVLFGYALFFVGAVTGIALLILALGGTAGEMAKRGGKPSLTSLWELYIGLGILSIIGLLSYGLIIGGQFRCMFFAPERRGARWFMLLCIACLFLGPAFHVGSVIASWQGVQEVRNNPGRLHDFHLSVAGQWLQMSAFGASMLYPLCFCLFLRATAACLNAVVHVWIINLFLLLGACMAAATAYLLLQHPPGGKPIAMQELIMLNVGWGVLGLFYIGLILAMRVCIANVMSTVKSPLEMS
jgi:hypothetical protein